jgi:hypothetical protein
MNNNTTDENKTEENVWLHGKSIEHLASSENNLNNERKEIIRKALEFDIIDIRTYAGYKGDLLVEVTTMETDVVRSLKKTAETLGFEVIVQRDLISVYKIFCITPSLNTYALKEDV